MACLGVNIDHVATIREARKIVYPDPIIAAGICQKAGADSVVCHLREDRRHIQDRDVTALKKILSVKFNLEMAMSREIIEIALKVKPDQVTIVPEKRRELTTEGGLDVISRKEKIRELISCMRTRGIRTSLFIAPEIRQIKASKEVGADMIELHTGSYANAEGSERVKYEYEALKRSAFLANKLGIKVFAGHGLNYDNIKLVKEITEIEEYNIGHSIIARAIFVGLEKAVKEMKALLK